MSQNVHSENLMKSFFIMPTIQLTETWFGFFNGRSILNYLNAKAVLIGE